MSFFRNGMATGLYTSGMGPRTLDTYNHMEGWLDPVHLGHLLPHGIAAGTWTPTTTDLGHLRPNGMAAKTWTPTTMTTRNDRWLVDTYDHMKVTKKETTSNICHIHIP
jgi:hypothetical protein